MNATVNAVELDGHNSALDPTVPATAEEAAIHVEPAKVASPPPEDVSMGEEPVEERLPVEVVDVKMADTNGDTNGYTNGHSSEAQTPVDTPAVSNTPADSPSVPADSPSLVPTSSLDMSFHHSPPPPSQQQQDDDNDGPPPAKRARTFSDADKASITHSATPPPASASTVFTNGDGDSTTPVPTPATPTHHQSTLSIAQHRFCLSTVRQLKKLKDAGPFLRPVDPIALNIPHYPSIIKTPMDFSTVERKINSSNPAKPDPNPENPRYHNADEFIADVRLIFTNCVTFNGPEHVVTSMSKKVEEAFDRAIKNMPPALEVKAPIVKKSSSPPLPPPVQAKKPPVRRPSTSVPAIRRSDAGAVGRPKREIHPPPPKDLPYADAPKKPRRRKGAKDDGTIEQLKFCGKILQDFYKKQHWAAASPFYEPVDWVKLEIPDYPKIVKKPMDMSTMRQKLDSKEYASADKFYDDFKLMIRNCFNFNPPGTPVNQAGKELQRLFDEKWKNLPALHDPSDDEDEDEVDDSEDERARAIAMMESQIDIMRGNIAALKGSKTPKEKKEKKKTKTNAGLPVASTSKAVGKQQKMPGKKRGKKPISDDDVLTFEQKKDLSEAIQQLDGTKLEKVIQIIHEGVPEIRDSTDEIELEIDLLPATVLTKLYNFVLRPLRNAGVPKRNRAPKGTGTGGLKRKSMDEDVEAEKIRMLEARMRMFEDADGGGATAAAAPERAKAHDSDHSSDSSSGSDSSGSDTE